MLKARDIDKAIEFIDKHCNNLKETEIKKYCNNIVINSILSCYFNKIKKENIELKYQLDIPSDIEIDEKDLSIIFAKNAIENAINACKKLDDDKKRIEMKFITNPKMVFEISNISKVYAKWI